MEARTILVVGPCILSSASITLILQFPACKFVILLGTTVVLYPLALLSLSFVASIQSRPKTLRLHVERSVLRIDADVLAETVKQNDEAAEDCQNGDEKQKDHERTTSLVIATRITGMLAAASILSLPFTLPSENPLAHCVLRVVSFFYACKLLDLTVARAHLPPQLLPCSGDQRISIPLSTWTQHWEYTSLLLTEFRYPSFNTRVIEKGRDTPNSTIWTYGPIVTLPILAYAIPTPETLVLCLLLAISLGLEGTHILLRRRSDLKPLFWQPFAADSISSFWGVHWHQAARPFLYSLGYSPAKAVVERLCGPRAGAAAGVLGAFGLSGIWHGWAAAALVEDPWMMGSGLWAVFVGHGIVCLMEKALGKRGLGRKRVLQGPVVWMAAVLSISFWIRAALPRAKVAIPWPPT